MKFNLADISGVHLKELKKNIDDRGVLIETFRMDEFPEQTVPLMSYASFTNPRYSRGPHEHRQQTDVFSFFGPGAFKLFLWDNRKESTTYLNKMLIDAGHDFPLTVIIPPGVVHAYKNISDREALVINYPDKLYKGYGKKDDVDEIRHEDSQDEFFRDFIA